MQPTQPHRATHTLSNTHRRTQREVIENIDVFHLWGLTAQLATAFCHLARRMRRFRC